MQTSLLGGPLCTLYYYSPCYFRLDHGPISLCSGVYAELPFWDYEISNFYGHRVAFMRKGFDTYNSIL